MEVAILSVAVFIGAFLLIKFLQSFLYICKPNEVLVFQGRKSRLADGMTRDYTVLTHGRSVRIPIIEVVRRIDLQTMTVDVNVANAFSRGAIPLNVYAIANVKICARPGIIDNALERFLDRHPNEIRDVAKETIEGALRGVLAKLTPEQVNEERSTFIAALAQDVEDDLNQLGLTIDTLNIQSVTDNVSYLDNIGRSRIASARMHAEVAESNKRREAEEVVAAANSAGAVARERALAEIQRSENNLRREKADLEARARSAEEQTEQAALEARARAEVQLQEVRTELQRLRLYANEVIPAEARQYTSRLAAEGESAVILARGEAQAEALQLVAQAYRDIGENAEDIFVLEQLDTILKLVAAKIGEVEVANVNLVDRGDGETLGRLAGAYPAMVANVLESVAELTGVDVRTILSRKARPQKAVAVSERKAGALAARSLANNRFANRERSDDLGSAPSSSSAEPRAAASSKPAQAAAPAPAAAPASAPRPAESPSKTQALSPSAGIGGGWSVPQAPATSGSPSDESDGSSSKN